MKKSICLIAPYEELLDIADEACCQLEIGIDKRLGNLEDGIAVAEEAKQLGRQVIISRGGTASIIKNHTDLPVVEVKVTGYDLLKSLYPLKDHGNTIGVVGYKNVVEGCKTICKIIGLEMKEVIIPNDDQTIDWQVVQQQVIALVKQHGIKEVIGDTTVSSKLSNLNVNFYLITSGKESVIQAIDEAVQIMAVRDREKAKARRFKAAIDFVHDAVIACDENGFVTVVNPKAEKIFTLKKRQVIGKPINEVIDNTGILRVLRTGVAELDQLQETDHGYIMTNRIPISVDGQTKGVVATFQDVSKIQGTEQKIRQNLYSKGFTTRYSFNDYLTTDNRMQQILKIAQGYAKTNATVLIEGESGTGKEILAQSIHNQSDKKDGAFVAVNCGALPPQLLESELFGYVDGAFTGAKKGGKMGLFELAHNGTIFLDEIGEMDKGLQAQLLRVLEEKQVMRLGSDKIIPINVRVIAATNVDLQKEIQNENFRLDLYFRLNVLKLQTLPLRDRKTDIEYLANYFVEKINHKYGRQIEHLNGKTLQFLMNYHWPGNVRELKNIIERIVLSATRNSIQYEDIELIVDELRMNLNDTNHAADDGLLKGTMKEIKCKVVKNVLEQECFNKSRTAKRLGIDRSTVERYLSS